MKVLLKSFHLNVHTIAFSTDSKVRTTYKKKKYHVKVLLKRFHLNVHTIGSKVRTTGVVKNKIITPCGNISEVF